MRHQHMYKALVYFKSKTSRSFVNKVAESALNIGVTFWYVSHKHPLSVSLYTIAGRLGVLLVFFLLY